MATKIGGLYADIRADRTNLKSDLAKAHRSIATAAERMQRRLSSLAVRVSGVAGLVAVEEAMRRTIQVGVSFEQSMATIRGVMRATDDEFMALEESAREMGETTEFSATQAASALQFLGMAGARRAATPRAR